MGARPYKWTEREDGEVVKAAERIAREGGSVTELASQLAMRFGRSVKSCRERLLEKLKLARAANGAFGPDGPVTGG